MFKKKIKLPIYNNETKIIINALNEFRNKIIKQGRYTEPVDELILKINIFVQKKMNKYQQISGIFYCLMI